MEIIITGSTGGIGQCLVKRAIASHNIERIYCQYRNRKKFVDLFGNGNSKLVAEEYDTLYQEKTSHILKELYKNKPKNVACVYTAFSISPIKKIGTYSLDEIKDNIDLNIRDIVFLTNCLVQFSKECKSQLKLIHFDSGAAYKPLDGWGMYCASKAYLNMFFQTVQLENPEVKIVSYEPGVVNTPMQEKIREVEPEVFAQVQTFREYQKKGILRDPDMVAEDVMKRFVVSWEGKNFQEGYGK